MTCLQDISASEILIKSKYINNYKAKIQPKKVEYSTATSMYCTTHDVKFPFCMPEFSITKIITNQFYINDGEGDTLMGYEIIIGRDLMVQFEMISYFKRKSVEWYGGVVTMK